MTDTTSPVKAQVPEEVDAANMQIVSPLPVGAKQWDDSVSETLDKTCTKSVVEAHFPLMALFSCISFSKGDDGDLLDVLSPPVSWRTVSVVKADKMGQDVKKEHYPPCVLLCLCHPVSKGYSQRGQSAQSEMLSICTSETSDTIVSGPVSKESMDTLVQLLGIKQDSNAQNPSQLFKLIIDLLSSKVDLKLQHDIQKQFENLSKFLLSCWEKWFLNNYNTGSHDMGSRSGGKMILPFPCKKKQHPNLGTVSCAAGQLINSSLSSVLNMALFSF